MIALDFNNPVFDRTAGSAFLFQLLSKDFEFFLSKGYSGYHADPAPLAAFGLAAYPHHTVTHLPTFLPTAAALFDRVSATRAGSPGIGRVNQACNFCFIHFFQI
jgi:hypothetical protein